MKLKNVLIVVKDIRRSEQFYHDLFGLETVLDNDGNMILTEGLVLQEENYWKEFLGCCPVTVGFSTFDCLPSGVFEDFFIRPEYRHQGIARRLVGFAFQKNGASTLIVGCADCDAQRYQSLGFTVTLGNLPAFE